jgi:CubicO group peptidase (beta-lactamase class C family)
MRCGCKRVNLTPLFILKKEPAMIGSIRARLSKIARLAAAASLLAFCLGQAQDKTQQIDQLVEKYYEYGQFNGAVLVAEHGVVIFKKGYGEANKEWAIPNTPDTKFRLGSITKQFTATLILQLVEQGKIRLDGKITDYIPDYPKAVGDKVTVQHLLTHTSGIPNYTSIPMFGQEWSKIPFTPTEFIKNFWDLPLEFEPGSRFAYDNSGYFLLGVIIEKVTGKPYAQVLRENILDPPGMKDSGYDMPDPILPKRASGYEKRGGTYINAPYLDMTTPYAAGALYSTVEDLYRWDQALYGDKILSKESKAAMFEPRVVPSGTPLTSMRYAFGWFVGKEPMGVSQDSVFAVGHGGSINGFNSLITRIPESKSLIVLLNNTGAAPLASMERSILGILYGKPYAPAKRSVADVLQETIRKSGIEAAIRWFDGLKDKKDEYSLSENQINSLGYEYLQAGKLKEAIEIFKLNVTAFPQSFNVYDSLGEAYAAAGERDLAIKNYEKSLELNPKSQSGIDALKKLRAQ